MESDQSIKPTPKTKKRRGFKKLALFLILFVIVGGSIGAAAFYYDKYQEVRRDPQIVTQEESRYLAEKAGKHISLPQDETPTIAEVSDKDQLKSQSFFANAQNGDKVLIYAKAKKAVLYRPSEDKVIEVAPLVFDDTSQTSESTN